MIVKGPAFRILLASFTASTTATELKSLVLQVGTLTLRFSFRRKAVWAPELRSSRPSLIII